MGEELEKIRQEIYQETLQKGMTLEEIMEKSIKDAEKIRNETT